MLISAATRNVTTLRIVLCLLAATTPSLTAQQPSDPWRVTAAPGTGEYSVAIDSTVVHGGRASARITGRIAHAMGAAIVVQRVRADGYRGKRVRLSAYVKTDQVRGVGAVVKIVAQRGVLGSDAWTALSDPLVGTRNWVQVHAELDVPSDAVILALIGSLNGSGTVWVDDVSLEPVGNSATAPGPTVAPSSALQSAAVSLPSAPDALGFEGVRLVFPPASVNLRPIPLESPRAATEQGLDNLVAFAHLFGVVRHFSPTEAVRTTNWDEFAMHGIRQIEAATGPESLARGLQASFAAVAPEVRVYPTGITPPSRNASLGTGPNAGVATWVNTGIAAGGIFSAGGIYSSELVVRPAPGGIIPDLTPDPAQPWMGSLGGGVSAIVPVAQWVELPATEALRRRAVQPAQPTETASPSDRATRLAGVIAGWNVIQHSYPYFDLVKTDWDAALRVALTSSATDSTPADYLNTLGRMMAALRDGHGNAVPYVELRQTAYLPVCLDWVEDQLVVDCVAPAASAVVQRGDVILTMDGVPAESALRERERTISGATPQWRRHRAVNELEIGPHGTSVTLRLRPASGGALRNVRLSYEGQALEPPGLDQIAEVRPGVFYVDLSRITDADFTGALPTLEAAKGIVFDMRGYPRSVGTPNILARLASDTTYSANFLVPIFSRPFMADVTWRAARWTLPAKTPHIGGKIAFLIGGGAISYAESTMGIVEQYKLGEIVGSTTAGTNGNTNQVVIPGGFRLIFTGMKVTKLDDSPHHGVGIRPTVPVSRTLKGVAAGRDEVLEKGIAVVSGPPK